MPSIVRPVPLTDLASLPTKRLLGLRDRLLRCERCVAESDLQTPADFAALDPSVVRFQDDPRWAPLYEATLAVLNTREHVPREHVPGRRGRSPHRQERALGTRSRGKKDRGR